MSYLKILFKLKNIVNDLTDKIKVTKKINEQVDFLLFHSNKKMRRKWNRILTNTNSPFYIGDKI